MKGEGLFIASLEKNPRVLRYDNAFMDEGGFMVMLVKGFAFYDAVERTEDDPDGARPSHGKSFYSIREAQRAIRDAEPCKCGRCVS